MKIQQLKKTFLIAAVGVTMTSLFISCKKDNDNNTPDNRPYSVSGTANSSQMVPTGTGTGTANFSGTYNPATRMMTYTSTWTGLSGGPSSAGFYSGATGTTGTQAGMPWTIGAGSTGTGTTTGSMILSEAEATQMTNGNWYYSYGTTTKPGGEVRGQLRATR